MEGMGPSQRNGAAGGVGNGTHVIIVQLQAVLEGSGESHHVVEGGRVLKLHVSLQRVAEATGEEVDMVLLLKGVAVGEQGQKLRLVLLHCVGAVQLHQGAERVAARRGAKRPLHLVDEFQPGGHAVVLLQALVPILGCALHVEGGQPHPLIVLGVVSAEELLS